jgi:2-amino-4-hydroxy-6-hydroxymethyldihydropteridine diphosphokinase
MEAGLSLGSNRGNRPGHLRQAVRRLTALPGLRVLARSRVYETDPVDVPEAFRNLAFLNAVVIVEWAGSVRELLVVTQGIEKAAGRRPGVRNGPRPLDIDILYAGAGMANEPDLVVPHPRWKDRRFVVEPLADVRPDLKPPGSRRTVREVLAALPPGGVRVWNGLL